MKKILAFVLAAVLSLTSVASAQLGPGSTGISVLPPGSYNFVIRNLKASVSVRQGKGTFYGMEVYNGTGATVYVQVFNQNLYNVSLGFTAPDQEVPCATLTFCTDQIYLTPGIAFVNGISVGATTTEGGGTPISTNGLEVWIQYQ